MTRNTQAENPYATPTNSSELEKERPKPNSLNWKLPSVTLGFMVIGYLFLRLMAASGGDVFELFILSGLIMLLATPIYGGFVVWLTVQRIRTDTNRLIITLFQLFVLGLMPWWAIGVMTFVEFPTDSQRMSINTSEEKLRQASTRGQARQCLYETD